LFTPPWRWPHKWPKHVGGYPVIKLLWICWYWYCTQILH
jgi:hypothetical protein